MILFYFIFWFFISFCTNLKQIKQKEFPKDFELKGKKGNIQNSSINEQKIISPPLVQEEVVFVPTPIDSEKFKLMNQQKQANNEQRQQEQEQPFIVDEQYMELFNQLNKEKPLSPLNLNFNFKQKQELEPKNEVETTTVSEKNLSFDSNFTKKIQENSNKIFNEILLPQNNGLSEKERVNQFIKLQESDYDKYFKMLNKMEYEKVFNSLNKKNMNEIYDKMSTAENNIDFDEYFKEKEKETTKIPNRKKDRNSKLSKNNKENENLNEEFTTQINDNANMNENDIFSSLYNKRLTDREFEEEMNKILSRKQKVDSGKENAINHSERGRVKSHEEPLKSKFKQVHFGENEKGESELEAKTESTLLLNEKENNINTTKNTEETEETKKSKK